MQNDCGGRLVIRSFENQQAVVVAQGPVNLLDLRAKLLRLGLENRRSLGRVVDVFDAMLGELDRRDNRRHFASPCWVGIPFGHDSSVAASALRPTLRRRGLSSTAPSHSPSRSRYLAACSSPTASTKACRCTTKSSGIRGPFAPRSATFCRGGWSFFQIENWRPPIIRTPRCAVSMGAKPVSVAAAE